jgi:hypothetical protein
MKDRENSKKDENEVNIPKSSKSKNTYKDFNKICRAYYDELMHLSKEDSPSLSQKDIIILKDLIHEIVNYSNELLNSKFIQEAKKILDIGLVISDFFLKIFGEMSEMGNSSGGHNNSKLSEKLKYPLSLKLLLLKANFNILNNYENDYINGEKNLNEIIEIQLYLKSSSYHLAASKFHMAKIKYFQKNYEEAKKYALDAKNLFENYNNNKKDDNNSNSNNDSDNKNKQEEDIIEKKITQNVSNIFTFLAQISLINNDFKSAGAYYEKGYYLNLGRYGAESQITEYFKRKLDIINEEIKKNPSTNQTKTKILVNSNPASNMATNNNNFYNPSNFIGNILHKGKADTFSFKIPTSSLYEPFLLSVYVLGEDDNNRYAPELFLGNLCFDKHKLGKYLKLKGFNDNSMFYTDDNLNTILRNIICFNGTLSFLDKNLKNSLISSSCPMKKK